MAASRRRTVPLRTLRLAAVVLAASLAGCGGRVAGEREAGGVAGSAGTTGQAGSGGTSHDSGGGEASADAGFDSGGEAGSGGMGGTGDDAGGTPCGIYFCNSVEQCWNNTLCVAKLVPVPGGYSIDATEVTRSQYEAWLATSPSTEGQDAWCSFNTDFQPDEQCIASDDTSHGGPCGKCPQVCVDWCDAYAYCRGVGKRLCGAIGGGPNGYDDAADASKSQWYNACGAGGLHNYPYGGDPGTSINDGYDPELCNGIDHTLAGCEYWACWSVEVASLSGCVSTEAWGEGIYDLSGNVWEWEDSCQGTTDPMDGCSYRGGSFAASKDRLRCASAEMNPRKANTYEDLGLRCCAP